MLRHRRRSQRLRHPPCFSREKHGGAAFALFELNLMSSRALGRSHISRFTAPPRWGSGSLGARLAARFLPMQCVCGSAGPPKIGGHCVQFKHLKKSGCPLCRSQHSKNLSSAAGRASCIKRLRTACWGGRGAGTPAPEKQTLRQNFQGVKSLEQI